MRDNSHASKQLNRTGHSETMKVHMDDRQGIGVLEQSIYGPYGLEGHIAPPS